MSPRRHNTHSYLKEDTHKHRFRNKTAGAPRYNAGQQKAGSAHQKGDCHQEKEKRGITKVCLILKVKRH